GCEEVRLTQAEVVDVHALSLELTRLGAGGQGGGGLYGGCHLRDRNHRGLFLYNGRLQTLHGQRGESVERDILCTRCYRGTMPGRVYRFSSFCQIFRFCSSFVTSRNFLAARGTSAVYLTRRCSLHLFFALIREPNVFSCLFC